MCNLKSMIVLRNKVFCPLDYDHHTEMLEELGIKDDVDNSTVKFVRVEMLPVDNNIFNHNLDNWKIKIDQPNTPEWFNEFKAEEDCKKELIKFFEQRFYIDCKNIEIYYQRVFIENSSVVAWGKSYVVARETSSVEAWGNSYVIIPSSRYVNIKGIHNLASVKDLSNKPIIYVADKNLKTKVWKNKI